MGPDCGRGDFRGVDQHNRVPDMELHYRAVDGVVVECGGVVVECGPAEKLPDGTVTGDSGVLPSSLQMTITTRSTSAKEP